MAKDERTLILIRGPSGVGKTSAGRALAARLGYKFIDEDEVRHLFKGDCLCAGAFDFAVEQMKKMTRSGSFVVAGCFMDKHCVDKLAPDEVFLLTAHLPTLFVRNRGMPVGMQMAEERIRYLHDTMEKFGGEKVIDTEDKTLEQVVDELYQIHTCM